MIREAVILAAGKGTRIRESDRSLPKPLHVVAGLPLIKRTIMTLARAGVQRVVVIVGFMAEEIRRLIEDDPVYERAGVTVVLVENPDFEKANGVSVLAARGHVSGPFLLSMSDHVYEPEVAAAAARCDAGAADLWLCVDRRVAEVYDIDDATKVATDGGRIVNIGKTIPEYDCIDCGVFAVTPALFDALEAARAAKGDCSLSDGVKRLAEAGRARVVDIGDAFWQDVDTPGALRRAEHEIVESLRKPTDGPVARLLNRRLSLALTRRLLSTRVTPHQLTVLSSVIAFAGIGLVLGATWLSVLAGALLVQISSILDGCDGELARLRYDSTRAGEWADYVMDNVVNAAYGVALGWASTRLLGDPLWFRLGVAAAAGYALYDLAVYSQLARTQKGADHFAFRWWFQREDDPHLIEQIARRRAPRLVALIHALTRRDLFLLAFLFLCLARLPQLAVAWYAVLAGGHVVLTALHLVLGGGRPRAAEIG